MKGIEHFPTVWKNINISQLLFNEWSVLYDIFKTNNGPVNISYFIAPYSTVPFIWYQKAVSLMPESLSYARGFVQTKAGLLRFKIQT